MKRFAIAMLLLFLFVMCGCSPSAHYEVRSVHASYCDDCEPEKRLRDTVLVRVNVDTGSMCAVGTASAVLTDNDGYATSAIRSCVDTRK